MNTTTPTLRWGIIGCGDVTEIKSGPAYQKTDGFKIQAVMRRDFSKAKDYAKRHGVPIAFETAEELINSPEVDAVYIATPPDSHKEYALAVAAAGKPCCIEKPMAPRHADCLEILAAFEASQTPVFVAYYRRCLPRFRQVKQWIDSGKIGTPRHVHWQLSKPPTEKDLSKTYNWRTDAKIAKGGHFDDLASHGLDLFSYLFGNTTSAAGHATNQLGLYTAFDAISASWIHTTGVTGTGFWNFGSHDHVDHVEVIGDKGKINFAVFSEDPIELHTSEEQEKLEIPHPENVQLHFVQALRDALLSGIPHPSSGKNGAHASLIIDQILNNQ